MQTAVTWRCHAGVSELLELTISSLVVIDPAVKWSCLIWVWKSGLTEEGAPMSYGVEGWTSGRGGTSAWLGAVRSFYILNCRLCLGQDLGLNRCATQRQGKAVTAWGNTAAKGGER